MTVSWLLVEEDPLVAQKPGPIQTSQTQTCPVAERIHPKLATISGLGEKRDTAEREETDLLEPTHQAVALGKKYL